MFAKVLVMGVAVAALAIGQGRGGGGGGSRGMSDESGMGGGMGSAHPAAKESKAEMVADRLKLNSEQKVAYNSLLEETRKDAASIIEQVQKSRNSLANGLLNGKSDAEMAPLKQALSDAQFQMMGVEVKTFQKIVALLKPNQISRAPEAFDLMAGIFLQPVRGRGGWGR